MHSRVEGVTGNDDIRVNRSLFTPVEECNVYGYYPGWYAGGSFFGIVSRVGDSLSGDYAYCIRGSWWNGRYSSVGEHGDFCRDRGKGFL